MCRVYVNLRQATFSDTTGIVVAGWFRDASEVGTTASSFRILAAQPGGLGRWLLGVTAAGFVAYGLYQIMHARYLHIRLKR